MAPSISEKVPSELTDKVIVITGGTGSFGHVMARHSLRQGCREVRIVSRDEAKQDAQRHEFSGQPVQFFIGDIRNKDSLVDPFAGSDLVFHAAALKQVPSCEFFPLEAVKTNVEGSSNVLEVASTSGVHSVVALSTDKAVQPINAMGMTKALMEKLVHAWARSHASHSMKASVVRYGNVMYSRGSVIPLFVDCVRRNRPLPLTDPTMTRFLMPLDAAIELVEHALINGQSGDTFIKKAPAATVGDLARAINELFGRSDEVEVIGFRHGEKLYETLATSDELRRSDDQGDYLRIGLDSRTLDYGSFVEEGLGGDAPVDGYHSHNTQRLDLIEIKRLLCGLPEIRADLKQHLGENLAAERLLSISS